MRPDQKTNKSPNEIKFPSIKLNTETKKSVLRNYEKVRKKTCESKHSKTKKGNQ